MLNISNRTNTHLYAVLLLPLLFSACSFTKNQNSFMDKVVQSAPLGGGKTLNVGYKLPDPAAGCQLVDESSRNWAKAQTIGQVKAGGGRQVLLDDAVASVKQRPDAGINYVALTIPNEAGLGAINLSVAAEAKTSYFRCTIPPSSH